MARPPKSRMVRATMGDTKREQLIAMVSLLGQSISSYISLHPKRYLAPLQLLEGMYTSSGHFKDPKWLKAVASDNPPERSEA